MANSQGNQSVYPDPHMTQSMQVGFQVGTMSNAAQKSYGGK